MINKCNYCGNKKLKFIETPILIHYGKMVCQHCGKFSSWVRNPDLPKNNRINKKSVQEVCSFHQILNEEICFFCLRNKKELGDKETLTVDHIQEIDKGGLDIIQNMQVLCSACHKLKNWARLYINWHFKNIFDRNDTTTV